MTTTAESQEWDQEWINWDDELMSKYIDLQVDRHIREYTKVNKCSKAKACVELQKMYREKKLWGYAYVITRVLNDELMHLYGLNIAEIIELANVDLREHGSGLGSERDNTTTTTPTDQDLGK